MDFLKKIIQLCLKVWNVLQERVYIATGRVTLCLTGFSDFVFSIYTFAV